MSSGFTSNAYPQDTINAYVRCVRGNGTGEGRASSRSAPAPVTAASGEVTDITGLDLATGRFRDTVGRGGDPWSGVAGYCASLGLNGHTWRVPSINELAILVDEAHVGPAINKTTFRSTLKYGSTLNNRVLGEQRRRHRADGRAMNFYDGFTAHPPAPRPGERWPRVELLHRRLGPLRALTSVLLARGPRDIRQTAAALAARRSSSLAARPAAAALLRRLW